MQLITSLFNKNCNYNPFKKYYNFKMNNLPSNKSFGLLFSGIFLILSIYFSSYFNNSQILFFTFFTLFILFSLITIIYPNILFPLNKLWMKLGLILGKIAKPIILGVIFFGMFTPLGLFMRIVKKRDVLEINFQKKTKWKQSKSNHSVESFRWQF